MIRHKAVVVLTFAVGLVVTSAAHADVMEVGPAGYKWVVGGPVLPLSDNMNDGASPVGGNALTIPPATAGPAQWAPYITALAGKYGISPALLEAVVWQESRWHSGLTSAAGAHGLAQLMPATARHLGVDPLKPAENLAGGARYLRMQLDAFDGDIERALAAYNAGPARVRRAGGVPRIAETQAYVAAIMARLAQPVRR